MSILRSTDKHNNRFFIVMLILGLKIVALAILLQFGLTAMLFFSGIMLVLVSGIILAAP